MRRVGIALASALAIFLLALGALAYATFAGRRPLEARTADGVHTVVDGIVAVSIIPTPGGALLVDCGNDPEGTALIGALGAQGLAPGDVAGILLTHGHADHVGACHRFPQARIVSLAEEVDHIEGREKPRGPLPRLVPLAARPFSVTDPLRDGDRIELGGATVEALHLPGHTAGSAAYLVDGVLFLGDSATISSDGQTLYAAPWAFTDSTVTNRAALVALAQRLRPRTDEIRALHFSHSGPASGLGPLLRFAP